MRCRSDPGHYSAPSLILAVTSCLLQKTAHPAKNRGTAQNRKELRVCWSCKKLRPVPQRLFSSLQSHSQDEEGPRFVMSAACRRSATSALGRVAATRRRAVHLCLCQWHWRICAGQSLRWHNASQYLTCRQGHFNFLAKPRPQYVQGVHWTASRVSRPQRQTSLWAGLSLR